MSLPIQIKATKLNLSASMQKDMRKYSGATVSSNNRGKGSVSPRRGGGGGVTSSLLSGRNTPDRAQLLGSSGSRDQLNRLGASTNSARGGGNFRYASSEHGSNSDTEEDILLMSRRSSIQPHHLRSPSMISSTTTAAAAAAAVAATAAITAAQTTRVSRFDLVIEEDLPRLLDAYCAVDEGLSGTLRSAEIKELCALANVRYDPGMITRSMQLHQDHQSAMGISSASIGGASAATLPTSVGRGKPMKGSGGAGMNSTTATNTSNTSALYFIDANGVYQQRRVPFFALICAMFPSTSNKTVASMIRNLMAPSFVSVLMPNYSQQMQQGQQQRGHQARAAAVSEQQPATPTSNLNTSNGGGGAADTSVSGGHTGFALVASSTSPSRGGAAAALSSAPSPSAYAPSPPPWIMWLIKDCQDATTPSEARLIEGLNGTTSNGSDARTAAAAGADGGLDTTIAAHPQHNNPLQDLSDPYDKPKVHFNALWRVMCLDEGRRKRMMALIALEEERDGDAEGGGRESDEGGGESDEEPEFSFDYGGGATPSSPPHYAGMGRSPQLMSSAAASPSPIRGGVDTNGFFDGSPSSPPNRRSPRTDVSTATTAAFPTSAASPLPPTNHSQSLVHSKSPLRGLGGALIGFDVNNNAVAASLRSVMRDDGGGGGLGTSHQQQQSPAPTAAYHYSPDAGSHNRGARKQRREGRGDEADALLYRYPTREDMPEVTVCAAGEGTTDDDPPLWVLAAEEREQWRNKLLFGEGDASSSQQQQHNTYTNSATAAIQSAIILGAGGAPPSPFYRPASGWSSGSGGSDDGNDSSAEEVEEHGGGHADRKRILAAAPPYLASRRRQSSVSTAIAAGGGPRRSIVVTSDGRDNCGPLLSVDAQNRGGTAVASASYVLSSGGETVAGGGGGGEGFTTDSFRIIRPILAHNASQRTLIGDTNTCNTSAITSGSPQHGRSFILRRHNSSRHPSTHNATVAHRNHMKGPGKISEAKLVDMCTAVSLAMYERKCSDREAFRQIRLRDVLRHCRIPTIVIGALLAIREPTFLCLRTMVLKWEELLHVTQLTVKAAAAQPHLCRVPLFQEFAVVNSNDANGGPHGASRGVSAGSPSHSFALSSTKQADQSASLGLRRIPTAPPQSFPANDSSTDVSSPTTTVTSRRAAVGPGVRSGGNNQRDNAIVQSPDLLESLLMGRLYSIVALCRRHGAMAVMRQQWDETLTQGPWPGHNSVGLQSIKAIDGTLREPIDVGNLVFSARQLTEMFTSGPSVVSAAAAKAAVQQYQKQSANSGRASGIYDSSGALDKLQGGLEVHPASISLRRPLLPPCAFTQSEAAASAAVAAAGGGAIRVGGNGGMVRTVVKFPAFGVTDVSVEEENALAAARDPLTSLGTAPHVAASSSHSSPGTEMNKKRLVLAHPLTERERQLYQRGGRGGVSAEANSVVDEEEGSQSSTPTSSDEEDEGRANAGGKERLETFFITAVKGEAAGSPHSDLVDCDGEGNQLLETIVVSRDGGAEDGSSTPRPISRGVHVDGIVKTPTPPPSTCSVRRHSSSGDNDDGGQRELARNEKKARNLNGRGFPKGSFTEDERKQRRIIDLVTSRTSHNYIPHAQYLEAYGMAQHYTIVQGHRKDNTIVAPRQQVAGGGGEGDGHNQHNATALGDDDSLQLSAIAGQHEQQQQRVGPSPSSTYKHRYYKAPPPSTAWTGAFAKGESPSQTMRDARKAVDDLPLHCVLRVRPPSSPSTARRLAAGLSNRYREDPELAAAREMRAGRMPFIRSSAEELRPSSASIRRPSASAVNTGSASARQPEKQQQQQRVLQNAQQPSKALATVIAESVVVPTRVAEQQFLRANRHRQDTLSLQRAEERLDAPRYSRARATFNGLEAPYPKAGRDYPLAVWSATDDEEALIGLAEDGEVALADE